MVRVPEGDERGKGKHKDTEQGQVPDVFYRTIFGGIYFSLEEALISAIFLRR